MAEKIPRTASLQAMQSLFSAYDEDEVIDDDDHDMDMASDKISGSEDEAMGLPSPEPLLKEISPKPSPKPKMERKITKLVSYMADDANDEEDEEDSAEEEDEDNDVDTDRKCPISLVDYNVSMNTTDLDTSLLREQPVLPLSEDDVRLPPEPSGRCPKHLQAKIAGYYEKMLRSGQNLSNSIENRKDFPNLLWERKRQMGPTTSIANQSGMPSHRVVDLPSLLPPSLQPAWPPTHLS